MVIKAQIQQRCNAAARPAAPPALPRRRLLSGAALLAAALAAPRLALAKDFKEAQAEREERRKKLREAAGVQKETGRGVDAFDTPEYSLSEEAREPNFRMRQSEGTREQRGTAR